MVFMFVALEMKSLITDWGNSKFSETIKQPIDELYAEEMRNHSCEVQKQTNIKSINHQ